MEELVFYNPWWKDDFKKEHVKTFRRDAFERIVNYLETVNRIVVVKGPRRVGKTTLVYQLILHLLENGTDPKKILYISFDDPKLRVDFDKLLGFYKTEILKGSLEDEKVYIFLDEVQFLENWQYFLKKYYDRSFPIKFVVSGSSATLIKKASESLMGRTIEEVMLPFSFREFFEYRTGVKPEKMQIEEIDTLLVKKYEEKAKIVFQEYCETGGFPNLFGVDQGIQQKLMREDIVEKALYRDIVSIYDIKKPEMLERLFIYLANTTAQTANVNSISKRIGFSRQYLSKYITYLKNAYFIIAFRKYSKSAGKTIRSAEKIYCIDPAMISIFLSAEFEFEAGHIFESIVARHLFGKSVFYWKNYHEVDFVVKENGLLPIEVKYKSQYSDKDLAGLLEFCRKYGCKKAALITKDMFGKKEIAGNTVHIIPLWAYILFCPS